MAHTRVPTLVLVLVLLAAPGHGLSTSPPEGERIIGTETSSQNPGIGMEIVPIGLGRSAEFGMTTDPHSWGLAIGMEIIPIGLAPELGTPIDLARQFEMEMEIDL